MGEGGGGGGEEGEQSLGQMLSDLVGSIVQNISGELCNKLFFYLMPTVTTHLSNSLYSPAICLWHPEQPSHITTLTDHTTPTLTPSNFHPDSAPLPGRAEGRW